MATMVNGAELHYEDEGSGTPVVFVHGVWMSSRFFENQRPYLRERYGTIVLDFRGHGRSEEVDRFIVSLEDEPRPARSE